MVYDTLFLRFVKGYILKRGNFFSQTEVPIFGQINMVIPMFPPLKIFIF
jgi:hypothetical protein